VSRRVLLHDLPETRATMASAFETAAVFALRTGLFTRDKEVCVTRLLSVRPMRTDIKKVRLCSVEPTRRMTTNDAFGEPIGGGHNLKAFHRVAPAAG
jgi:hypothetical protein